MDERIKNIKVAVHTEEEREAVQDKLFKLGARLWYEKYNCDIGGINSRYLYVDKNLFISHSTNDKRFFDEHEYTEMYVDDLLKLEPIEEVKYIDGIMEFEKLPLGQLGLKFGDEQILWKAKMSRSWRVSVFEKAIETKICTTPTPRNRLEVGKWYYTSYDVSDFSKTRKKSRYILIVDSDYDKCCFIVNDTDVINSRLEYNYYYEVVKK